MFSNSSPPSSVHCSGLSFNLGHPKHMSTYHNTGRPWRVRDFSFPIHIILSKCLYLFCSPPPSLSLFLSLSLSNSLPLSHLLNLSACEPVSDRFPYVILLLLRDIDHVQMTTRVYGKTIVHV